MKRNYILKTFFILNFSFLIQTAVFSQDAVQCYPPNWWAGMKWNKVQLMLYGKDIGNAFYNYQIDYPGIKINKINRVENKNYVFLDVTIAPNVRAGAASIIVANKNIIGEVSFEIKARRKGNGQQFAQGVNTKDLIYLIMPDRFSNGDTTNDRIAGMKDLTLNRDTVFNRHGGDLKGIQNHLDYLQDIGVTSLWLNPVIENDMPDRTEHGYAFTNHYKVDPRLGGEKAYQELITDMHKRGMKIIQDAVYNHVGLYHFTIQDMPMKDWVHQWDAYTNTTYKDQALFDPYGSKKDYKQMADGWFTPQMPDLNQANPYVANYLIQHALWTVENFGIDGWRIDTYAYNDLEFMNRCNKALLDEYPKLTMFGETYVHGVPNQSFFVENNYMLPYKSNLQGITDFQTLWGITGAMTKDFGWTEGVNRLYTTLAQDFVYKDPTRNVIFIDNHDLSRFYSVVGENLDKYLSSLTWMLTCRGIPQLYYGDEITTPGFTSPNDGHVRLDFPGGWAGDKVNKFTAAGRTATDQAIFEHVKKLANYRKTSSALTTGKMMQYLPEDGLYVYFRYDEKQTVMVVINTAKIAKKIDIKKYSERTKGFTNFVDIISNTSGNVNQEITVGSYKALILELKK